VSEELVAEVSEELNVRSVEPLDSQAGLVDFSVKANFRELGRRFAKATPRIAEAISAHDPGELVRALREDSSFTFTIDGEEVAIGPDDVIITESPREGWAVASDAEESVAIDLLIDDDLRRAGLARELVRVIQEARKGAGFEITDRITVTWDSEDDDVIATFAQYASDIASEVLALDISPEQHSPADSGTARVQVNTELPVQISVARVAR